MPHPQDKGTQREKCLNCVGEGTSYLLRPLGSIQQDVLFCQEHEHAAEESEDSDHRLQIDIEATEEEHSDEVDVAPSQLVFSILDIVIQLALLQNYLSACIRKGVPGVLFQKDQTFLKMCSGSKILIKGGRKH